jgi:hypothetical protein
MLGLFSTILSSTAFGTRATTLCFGHNWRLDQYRRIGIHLQNRRIFIRWM